MIPAQWGSVTDWQRMVALQVNPLLMGLPPLSLASDPADPPAGLTYYNTTTGKTRTWDGVNSLWRDHY